jgi:hypothetical protein
MPDRSPANSPVLLPQPADGKRAAPPAAPGSAGALTTPPGETAPGCPVGPGGTVEQGPSLVGLPH